LGTGTSFVNQHEETGLVVPAGNVPALADAINRLLADENLRARMAAASLDRATRLFSKEALIRHTLAFYEEALTA
jgi:rhamnosyl/mannosyltransferase